MMLFTAVTLHTSLILICYSANMHDKSVCSKSRVKNRQITDRNEYSKNILFEINSVGG